MTAPGSQDPKNAPAPPSMIERCERQLRDYFMKIAEKDEARAMAYYDALSPMLLKQALGQMLGSDLDDMFGRAAAPQEYQPGKTADRAIRNLHRSMKLETGEHKLPVFQSIEDIKRFAADIDQGRLSREREELRAKIATEKMAQASAGTELVTQPYSTSDWVTAYFAPPPGEDAQRDLVFQSRDISDKSMKKTRRGLFGMLFGAKEEEVQEQRVRQDSVYYLAPVHKGGPIVVEGRVRIGNAPAGVTIVATGDVHVDYVGAGAFIVAGGNISVGETGSRAILISGKDAEAKYIGTYARVYARGRAEVSNCDGTIFLDAGHYASYPKKKTLMRPGQPECAGIIKEFCDVMDTIQNEPESVTALRNLFAEAVFMLAGGTLKMDDLLVLQPPEPLKALPAPAKKELSAEEEYREREGKLQKVFARYAGQRYSLSVAENMRREIKAAGYELRVLDEDSLMTMDINHRRVNVKINWDYDGKKYLDKKFTFG